MRQSVYSTRMHIRMYVRVLYVNHYMVQPSLIFLIPFHFVACRAFARDTPTHC